MTLRGTVRAGRQQAAGFLGLPWVAEQLREKLGLVPFPGTLNLHVADAASLERWRELTRAMPPVTLHAPDPTFCDAACHRVAVAGRIPGAVLVPDVDGYPEDLVEVVAAERLRTALGLSEGDLVSLVFPGAVP